MEMNKFVKYLIKPNKESFIGSYRIYNLYCLLNNIDSSTFSIKHFVKILIQVVKNIHNIEIVKQKKREGKKSIRGLVGIEVPLLMEQNYLEKILEVYLKVEQKGPHSNKTTQSIKEVTPKKSKETSKSASKMDTEVSLKEFILQYETGTKTDIIGTEDLQNLCLDFYKNSPKHITYLSSITHFTKRFKLHWDLEYPQNPLITKNIRDPNDRNKRGIACIKKKGS